MTNDQIPMTNGPWSSFGQQSQVIQICLVIGAWSLVI